ncbi:hypothetical protein BHE74_00053857 [Ensete ventricosum]|nr:hypothetical protein BHE74_00053857 [Ensete ventricosum]RZR93851.1 hypothetical protein BHM03_00022422 [Ensete ventricosum]
MDDVMLSDLISNFVRSALTKIKWHTKIKCFIFRTETDMEEEEQQHRRCTGTGELSHHDIKVIMGRLGLLGAREGVVDVDGGGGGGECRLVEQVDALLEEKKASLEELKEAFCVFDRNEDGFISPGELWCVMRRLGLREGLKLEDCERMIRAFDDDGDGRISFTEFTRLLENALAKCQTTEEICTRGSRGAGKGGHSLRRCSVDIYLSMPESNEPHPY